MNRIKRKRTRRNEQPARLLFQSLPPYWRLVDRLMTPFMYLALGNFYERPQETHAWNYLKLNPGEHFWLDGMSKVTVQGDSTARKIRYGFQHLTWLGGWKRFVVIRPLFSEVADGEEWYIGYRSGAYCGVSMIPLTGPVRMLIGPGDVEFFALNAAHKPVKAINIGGGRLGYAGEWSQIPLR